MEFNIEEIKHNYITRLIIFSVFLYKKYRTEENVYSNIIRSYVKKKSGYSVSLIVECGPKYEIEDKREILIENLLNDDDFEYMNLIVVKFKTSFKEICIQINLDNEGLYESYLYS